MTQTAANRPLHICVSALLVLLSSAAVHAEEEEVPPEPNDYWQGPMNGRVPATLSGGTVIGTEGLAELIRQNNPVLIDVLPAQRRPANQSTPWLPLPHRNIPRSVWIPGIGSGIISIELTDYLKARLAELTGHDREKMIVFYCRPNCWASWNAAKRAVEEGYRRVNWYPDGLEAWQGAEIPTSVSTPEGPGAE